jgi:integration host factor subunit beta
MLKSELIERISSQNPHLYDRDIEKVVNTIRFSRADQTFWID